MLLNPPSDTPPLKALIVDDERVARAALAMVLTKQGFECYHAEDGEQAFQLVTREAFDLIVTDLRMPRANGHQFATRVVKLKKRPLLVVHSGVDHPQLIEDLIRRGVDDIVFKPTNYSGFAVKMKALVERNRLNLALAEQNGAGGGRRQGRMEPPRTFELPFPPIAKPDLIRRIDAVEHLLPMSTHASDVYQAATAEDLDLKHLVSKVQCDPALTAELLRLANSYQYRRSSRSTVEVEEAIVRVGVRKTGEIALSLSGLATFREMIVPWINSDVLLMRAAASAAAMPLLADDPDAPADEATDICVQFYPLGRLFLGVAFPDEYRHLLSACAQQQASLGRAEQLAFPESPAWALGHLLKNWQIPETVWEPLSYAACDYVSLVQLSDSLRRRVERIKIAAFLGELAVGHFFHWDEIDPPSVELLAAHGIHNLPLAVAKCRRAMGSDPRCSGLSGRVTTSRAGNDGARSRVNYVSAVPEASDCLAFLLKETGVELNPIDLADFEPLDSELPTIINGTNLPNPGALDERLAGLTTDVLLVTDPNHKLYMRSVTRLAPLPVSHAWFSECCRFEEPAFA